MNTTAGNIVLIGPMGSGKTTVGRRVARNLGLEFHDCDEELEKRTGASVNLIFDIEGETGFRKRETALLAELLADGNRLVATGGGAILSASNRRKISRCRCVVWLKTSVDQQIRRLENDKKRPLLQKPDRREVLENLAQERDPLYAQLADLVFESSDRSARHMAAQLTTALENHLQQLEDDQERALH